jgi:diguanylate cyclase (GGDEF)-like protein
MQNDNALRDTLTGAFSRAALRARLQQEADLFLRYGKPFSLVVIDLDHFKSINDVFGHTRGDETLVEFAGRLRVLTRSADQVFRYGGDEFVLLLPHTDKEKAQVFARRLLDGVALRPFAGDPPLSLSVSVGIATCPDDGRDPERLFEIADRRHLIAKRGGRNRAIADDRPEAPRHGLEQPSRLLERDHELSQVQQCIAALPQRRRSLVVVGGAAGAGRTRFLEEVQRIAGMQGYLTLVMSGGPGLRHRVYGALADALGDSMPSPALGADLFAAAALRAVENERAAGIVLTLDNANETDRATQSFLQSLFFAANLPPFALICAIDSGEPPLDLLRDAQHSLTITLEPLSPASIQIWIRHSLQWDAPEELINWIHAETGGLPLRIQHAIPAPMSAGALRNDGGIWSHTDTYAEFPLAAHVDRQLRRPPHNLPATLPDLIGREPELRRIRALLPHAPLVTIVGPGGMGKTRLALQAAAESVEQFRDGVFFVSLSALNTAEDLIPAIADVLPLSIRPGTQAQLIESLRGRVMLLVLDNFEHLLAGVLLLQEILAQAGGVRMLVTARTQINAVDEEIIELSGLPYPASVDDPQIAQYGAVQLFLLTARQMHATVVSGSADLMYIAQICRLVEGMPLGIELAAAWLPSAGLDEIAGEIERSITSLNSERADIPARHRSLRAVVESFWSQLASGEQRIIQRLSIFRGGFDRHAAQQIAGASLFFLNALANQRYLVRTLQGRYEFHELLRQYAADLLQGLPQERSQLHDAHCEYYMQFLERHTDDLAIASPEVVALATAEHENLRAAWRWAVAQARIEVIHHSARGLNYYLRARGALGEAEAILRLAIDYLRVLVDVSDVEDSGSESTRHTLAILHAAHAGTLIDTGRYDQAYHTVQQAIQYAAALNNQRVMAEAYLELGRVYRVRKDLAAARQYLQRASELAQAEGAIVTAATAMFYHGFFAFFQGAYDEALALYDASLAHHRQTRNTAGESLATANKALTLLQCGDGSEALRLADQAVALSQAAGVPLSRAWALALRALIRCEREQYAPAIDDANSAFAITHEIQNIRVGMRAQIALGYAQFGCGEHDAAEATLQRLCAHKELPHADTIRIDAIAVLAEIAAARGAADAARRYLEEALAPPGADVAQEALLPLHYLRSCWRALEALGDSQAAQVRSTAAEQLAARAQHIADSEVRRRYLNESPLARALVA